MTITIDHHVFNKQAVNHFTQEDLNCNFALNYYQTKTYGMQYLTHL